MKGRTLSAVTMAAAALLMMWNGAAAQADPFLPAGAEEARERLDSSPRHGDWITVRLPGGDSVRSWIVHPERSDPGPVVVVIHEIYGLTSWVRAVADQLAAGGYVAVAPDLLTMRNVPRDASGDPERDPAVAAVRSLDADAVHAQIRAVAEHVMAMPSARQSYGIMGYCWGGSTSFEHATRYPDLSGAVVYYGGSPDVGALTRVRVPVIGFYGGDDERVNATIPRAEEALPGLYRAVILEGAGHGFLRQQSGREGANMQATEKAWPMTLGFFHGVFASGT